ncbi:MAG: iron ABC transporter substrate-binding protein [Chloroflexota bacterium]|nr:MAG: iron ABC transporter substrate-binding protein [Chloroflexota bacterium]
MKKMMNVVSLVTLLALLLTLAPAAVLAQEVVCEQDAVVQADDWLSKLADKFYGDVLAYQAIADATNAMNATDSSYAKIDNPDIIEPGWKLCIPAAESAQAAVGAQAEQTAVQMDALIAAAKEEGMLTTIALPHDWLNYGVMIENFKAKYGLEVNELDPNAGSGDELEAIRANKDNKGPQAPDVVDVGFAFGPSAKEEGLLQPYKVSTWASIPQEVKDPEGYWYGDYYGVLALEVNTDVVSNPPQDWADLLKPEYKGQVALAGDPRVSNQAILSVFAAGLSRTGDPATAAQAGLEFFAELNQMGNFVPVIADTGPIASGETPITIQWDYLALADRDNFAGNPEIEIVIPQSAVVAGVYVQGISAYAPHPNAAKLWMEYLYSDEGQLVWLSGYGHPIRYLDMAKRGVIPADLAAKLPAAELYEKAFFPTLEQIDAAKTTITEQWDTVVNADVQDATQ